MSVDGTSLPPELLVTPQPLIGFCGLDVQCNSVHKSIWDSFSSNRKTERAAVQFKLLPANYEFPVAKPKRASYEWYHPKGILKRNWLLKHLQVLPSVVVLFQDIEWNDVLWTDKQLQCASTIQSLKNNLQERNTRLCLVLLQKSAPLPPGEDILASERAASLTNACGISSKMLFILPHTEHLMGYTLRLESAFLDMSQSYYALMSKRIRTHRDQLTAAHTTLKIRHQFKLGFVAELRQDFSTALKHYTQAYANLDEIRIIDTNCLEIKTIAGFLNYKICRLMFKLKVPRDSINHFISHIDKYKNRVGFKDLVFEHYAWLSTQHSAFADLFCEAIKNGLPALQTQHPGIYYHKAAEYVAKRKEAFLECCALTLSNPTEPTTPTTLQSINSMALFSEFFGIRTVKTGELMSEQQVILLVQENEKNFKHSNVIIQLLGQAMAQFKIYKCLRFRKKLAIDMAEEYFKCGDHAKALTLYSLMLPDYRQDKWSSIFSDVLLKSLRCAFLSSSVADYISCSIEALSLKINYDQKGRILVLENLWKVFQCVPPVSQSQIAPELRGQWENALTAAKSPVQIDLDKITEFLECYVTFERVEVKTDEFIEVHLILKLLTDVPMKMRSFAVHLSDGNQHITLQTTKFVTFSNVKELRHSRIAENVTNIGYQIFEGDLKLEPNHYYQLIFNTEANKFFENTQIFVTHIEIRMGTEKLSALLTKRATIARNAFRHHNRCRNLDDNITINPICYIAPTFHISTQSNLGNDPMLVNEYHSVVTTVNNPHNVFLQNVSINISVPNNLRNKVFLTTDVSSGRQKLHSHIQIDIGELSMQSSNTASYYIFSLIEATIDLQQTICYNLDVIRPKMAVGTGGVTTDSAASSTDNSPVDARLVTSNMNALNIASPIHIEFIDDTRLRKTREDILTVRCMHEFKFCGRFYTLNRKPLTKIYRGENFLFRANIEVQSECDLDVLETYFICDHNLVQSTYSFKRKKYTNTYRCGEKLEDVIVLRTNSTLNDWMTAKDFERNKTEPQYSIFNRIRHLRKHYHLVNVNRDDPSLTGSGSNANLNKCLMSKIPTNMTIIGNSTVNAIMLGSQNSNMSTSTISDDGKLTAGPSVSTSIEPATGATEFLSNQTQKTLTTRMIYNKAIEAIQATGHCRGFIKGVVTTEQQQLQQQIFGVYCIKWRRHGCNDENESKFVIMGIEIEEPPMNIYCSIEEKMFVKMPMTLKIVLKNPTERVLHLISTLTINNSDNFICSGHKQLDISIFAYSEKELVYNLYPLCVGWQTLPELSLEYNTMADPSKDEAQNNLLTELVLRSMPKKVFVLPPMKQQVK